MITFDNNAGSDLSSSEDEDGPSKKDDFDLDDIDDVSITVWVTVGIINLIKEKVKAISWLVCRLHIMDNAFMTAPAHGCALLGA